MAQLTPLGKFTKWFAIPAVIAGIGYFLVGPRLGTGVLDKVTVPDKVRTLLGGPDSTKLAGNSPNVRVTAVSTGGPNVDVSVSQVAAAEPKRKPRKRRKRTVKPKVETPVVAPAAPIEAPPVDEGGSAGAATGGVGTEPPVEDTTGGDA